MSKFGTYIDGDDVRLDDVHGHHTFIPATRVGALLGMAKRADDARAMWALRWFDRDALQGAYDLLPVCANCLEAPAFSDMGDGHLFCSECCSSAAGSKYDDRTEA